MEWLIHRRIQEDNWAEALSAAIALVNLNPLCPASLFRLVTCYEQHREFVKAYDCFCKAMSLTPHDQREALKAKRARLKEQSDDQKEKVFRGNPLEILPLEVVLSIMKMGLQDDRHFVLKCSWVGKGWREVLNNHCPELWGTMVFNHKELRDQSYDAKRAAWKERAHYKFHTIIFEKMTKTAASKVNKTLSNIFYHVQKLDVNAAGVTILERLLHRKFENSCSSLQDLRIQGGWHPYISARDCAPQQELHCGFVATSNLDGWATENLHTIHLRGINLHMEGYLRPSRAPIYVPRERDPYPALKRLSLIECRLDETHADTERPNLKAEPRLDALHRALRGAPDLEYLKVSDDRQLDRLFPDAASSVAGKPIFLRHLHKAILPPPSAKCIDIEAGSKLTVLGFETEYGSRYHSRLLVPTVEASPIGQGGTTALARLKYVGFQCSVSDDIDRLVEWLPYLKQVRILVIRGGDTHLPDRYDPPPAAREPGRTQRAQLHILQTLVENPEWCPKLKHLQLSFCYVPEKQIAAYIQHRRESPDCTSLAQLTLHRCSTLTELDRESVEKQSCQLRETGVYSVNTLSYVDGSEDAWDEELQVGNGSGVTM